MKLYQFLSDHSKSRIAICNRSSPLSSQWPCSNAFLYKRAQAESAATYSMEQSVPILSSVNLKAGRS